MSCSFIINQEPVFNNAVEENIYRLKKKKPEKVLPTLKLVEDKKPEKKEIKTVSEQSQDELEPINSPMSDEWWNWKK